jgi:hypothetical protein
MMKPGEVLEMAIWLQGNETQEMKDRFRDDIAEALSTTNLVTGPVIMTELSPGDDRVPPVPDHIQGPDVKLLVGEATVLDYTPGEPDYEAGEGNFIGDLEPKDLERLRAILRRVHQTWNPGKPELSTEKCDEYINRNGPDAALAALRIH